MENIENTLKEALWSQFGASIKMLENAIIAFPESVWFDKDRLPWYWAFHTLFWLDCYLSSNPEGFAPPKPFTMSELDPAGTLPERTYTQQELLDYLQYCNKKCYDAVSALTNESMHRQWKSNWMKMNVLELHLYNMRHVQHGAAQLNLILRQHTNAAPNWVGQVR